MDIVLNGDRHYFIRVGDLIEASIDPKEIYRKAKEYRSYGKEVKIFKAIQGVAGFGIIRVLTKGEENDLSKPN